MALTKERNDAPFPDALSNFDSFALRSMKIQHGGPAPAAGSLGAKMETSQISSLPLQPRNLVPFCQWVLPMEERK